VEFALVAPVLFLVLFGIIDYGLWFADSITIRQAAAAGARQGSAWADGNTVPWDSIQKDSIQKDPIQKDPIQRDIATCGQWDPGTSPEIQALGCSIVNRTRTLGEPAYVKIQILNATLVQEATTWVRPNAVRVCLLQKHDSISGFIPLPGGMLTASADMPIESVKPIKSVTGRPLTSGGQANLPPGTNWDWCDVP
jgi:hypothetical protein